jgi:hypothetical protein
VPGKAVINDLSLAALLGTYLAEGNVSFSKDNPNTVVFTIHADDWAREGIPALVAKHWPDVTCEVQPKKNSKAAFSLLVYSAELARWMKELIGCGVRFKKIPMELLGSSEESRLEFMGRWLDGDGWVDKKGLHWSTCNYKLALQGRDLLLSLGIVASIYGVDHAKCDTSGYKNSGMEYTLNISRLDAGRLRCHSQKVAEWPLIEGPRSKPGCLSRVGDSFAYRIKKIEAEEVNDIPTWNFEVEGDHSYSAMGITSHNCTVPYDVCSACHNKAASRADYCTADTCSGGGCRHNLGKVAHNGDMTYVENPGANYIDISNVGRPADRIAYGSVADYLMGKAASDVFYGGAELAEQMGLMAPFQFAAGLVRGTPNEAIYRMAVKAAEVERAIERGELNSCVSRAQNSISFAVMEFGPALGNQGIEAPGTFSKAASAIRALADEQIMLPLYGFLSFVVGEKQAEALYPSVQARMPGLFGRMLEDEGSLEAAVNLNPFDPSRVFATSSTQRAWAHKYAAQYSLDPAAVQNRVTQNIVQEHPIATTLEPTKVASFGNDEGYARAYGSYQLALFGHLEEKQADFPLTVRHVVSQNYIDVPVPGHQ